MLNLNHSGLLAILAYGFWTGLFCFFGTDSGAGPIMIPPRYAEIGPPRGIPGPAGDWFIAGFGATGA